MTKQELKPFLDQFGIIVTGKTDFKKTMPGYIRDIDVTGKVWFVDNDGFGNAYNANQIDSFVPQQFEPLPEKYNGKEIYWKGGVVYYKTSNKEVDIKK